MLTVNIGHGAIETNSVTFMCCIYMYLHCSWLYMCILSTHDQCQIISLLSDQTFNNKEYVLRWQTWTFKQSCGCTLIVWI